jgi:HSP20 family protein
MAMTRYRDRNWISPWQELDQMTNRLNRIFGDRVDGETGGTTWMPPVSVEESRDELVLTAELPGLRQENVEIELENNVLTIRGEKEAVRQDETESRIHVWERRYGAFQRSFSLPRTVVAEDIQATFEDGLLQIRMPKAAEAKGRKIEIRTQA